MRILHVIRDLSVATGGPVRAVNGLAEAQARLGHHVTVLTTDIGEVKLVPRGVDVRMLHARAARWAWAPDAAATLEPLLGTADAVHLHMVWDHLVLVAARAARDLGVPYVLRPCGMFSGWSLSRSQLKKRLYLRLVGRPLLDASAFHFATEGERANALPLIGNRRAFVIPIGVDVPGDAERPEREAFARRFPVLQGRRIVLFLSRLHPKKHADVLLDAFARVCGMDDTLSLVLAGPGEPAYVATLRERARALGIESRVVFTGLLSGDAVREAHAAAEVFVLPSAHENFGVAAVEAMAMGCACIVSRNLDLAPEIEAAGAAITTAIDATAVAASLERVLRDASLRQRLGNAARSLVASRFAWKPIAKATVEMYAALPRR